MKTVYYYILFAMTALAISPFMSALIKRFSNEEKIFAKGFFKDLKFELWVALSTVLVVVALFYRHNLTPLFFTYSWLSILLIMDAFIDIRKQIIPNMLNFIGFSVGVILVYIENINHLKWAMDNVFGMLFGGGIFLLIALFSFFVYRKEGMGLGDVKLMGMLGIYFGFANTVQVFVLSFLVGAVVSILLLATKIKDIDDYIPFGPFISIAGIITMFIPATTSIVYVKQFLF